MDKVDSLKNLEAIISSLNDVRSELIKDNASYGYLESVSNDEHNEVIINADKVGLMTLALQILNLAQKDNAGSHLHLDKYSNLNKAEKIL